MPDSGQRFSAYRKTLPVSAFRYRGLATTEPPQQVKQTGGLRWVFTDFTQPPMSRKSLSLHDPCAMRDWAAFANATRWREIVRARNFVVQML